MERWDDLRYLVAVHKTGTMSGAARLLGANVGTVSRRIDKLTEVLGASPFLKTPEGWTSNPDMAPLIEAALSFESQLTTAMNTTRAARHDVPVPLRLGCPPIMTSLILLPSLSQLQEVLPGVRLTISHHRTSNALGENDLLITPRLPDKGRLLTRGIGALRIGFYALRGAPPSEDWVGLEAGMDDTALMQSAERHFGRPPILRLDGLDFVAQAIITSALAGPLPALLGDSRPELVPVDTNEPPTEVPFWLCYHESRRGDPALAAVTGWITSAFETARSR
ncbi:LysR family transcriptional regulator [Mesobaculum littorinae]|uniref:LysR family transcriptional regulator n=1 Tax=Mesobaculum littorinae TaxID=2486419 RepID=A0A438ALN8_9RHOB|nr:LysR family transcriptional regulator [Mesobaculum littorinae]RVV99554.1 LysR family transcriptional regulator [Mesobaculum littorinae]